MITVCIANQKGGVGKTTTAVSLGTGLMKKGFKVLFIDLDKQGNLSYIMCSDPKKFNIYDVLIDERCSIDEAIQKTSVGDIIQHSKMLSKADKHFSDIVSREFKLKKLLENVCDSYDYVIIDTPPALNILTVNALTASDYIVIPSEADVLSLQGIGQLYETMQPIKMHCNPKLKILGILLTQYSDRTNLSRDLTEKIKDTAKQLGTVVFQSSVRDTVVMREANTMKISIYDYATSSGAARDYFAFTNEFLKMVQEDRKNAE